MFNTYKSYSGGPSRVEVKKTVHEHRAPTDDSIRIYDEIRDKAVDSIVARGREPFAADVTWSILDCPMIMGFEIVGVFTLNDREHTFRVPVRDTKYRTRFGDLDVGILEREVYEALTKQVAAAMTEQMFRKHLYDLVPHFTR